MRVYNHEITMRRGEVLTIDKTIQNRDGSPYIIPKFNDNKRPHFVLTISSSLYPNESSIIYRMFMDVKANPDMPTFTETNPVNILDFTNRDGSSKLYENGFKSLQNGPPGGWINDVEVIYMSDGGDRPSHDYNQDGEINVDDDENAPEAPTDGMADDPCTEALFYYPRPDGTVEYKWWNGVAWKDYECRLVCAVPHADTIKWKEGNYYYSIDLIDHYVHNAVAQNVSEVYPILGATKLSVMSNLRGGNVW